MKYLLIIASLLIFSLDQLSGQGIIITGKISDTKGVPLPGVTVTAKDYPSLTTISGADGEYRIEIYDFTKALIFTVANMRTKEVLVGDTNVVNVTMKYMALKNLDPWSILVNTYSGQTNIYNKAIDENEQWNYSGDPGFLTSVEGEYFFTQNIGVGLGVGYNFYNSSNKINGYNFNENTIMREDADGDIYYLYNDVDNITEKWKVRAISFPIKFKLRFEIGKFNYYGNIGFKFKQISSAKIKSSGNSTWRAYYPAYHVVIYDVEPYDYTSHDLNSENSFVDFNKSMKSVIIEGGVSRSLTENYSISLGFFFERGFDDLEYKQPVHNGDFLNTVGIIDETILSAWGIMLGARYRFMKQR